MTTPDPGPRRGRDAAGRPLNPRPRDAAGRPLPPGSAGVARVDESVVLPPEEALAEAQRLLDGGYPFHAHEILEGAWKAAPAGERALWQGLAQLAVGLTHEQRGNRRGAASLLRRGAENIAAAPDDAATAHRLDAGALAAWGAARAEAVESAAPAGPALQLRSGPDPA